MSLINTNHSYLDTMGISKESPVVGIIVSVYYLGCAIGAVIASWLADKKGRRPSIFTCLATTALGNLLMFTSGLSTSGSSSWNGYAIACMLVGRIVMGLGVGGIDAVIPVYSSELSSDGARGRALAQEFQMNIFGLLMAYAINLGVTFGLGKESQWVCKRKSRTLFSRNKSSMHDHALSRHSLCGDILCTLSKFSQLSI